MNRKTFIRIVTIGLICLMTSSVFALKKATMHKDNRKIPLFKCGKGFRTYTAYSKTGVRGIGVRCVKFHHVRIVNNSISGVYWYGEGKRKNKKYRHIGRTYRTHGIVVSRAIDIYGNGEYYKNEVSNLKLSTSNNYKTIKVIGGWKEKWVFERNGISSKYRSSLLRVKKCGPYLDKLAVTDYNDSFDSGRGIRCVARHKKRSYPPSNIYHHFPEMWYGEGEWNGRNYRHLGFAGLPSVSNPPPISVFATGIDICNNSSYSCNPTAIDAIKVIPLMDCDEKLKFEINGAWNEYWTSRNVYLRCR